MNLEQFALATVLFVVYFSFISCFFYPVPSAASPSPVVVKDDVTELNEGLALSEAEGEDYVSPPETVPSPTESLVTATDNPLEERLAGIDLDTLQLRPARRIAKRLGIKQKVNGKDQPLSWLRGQIKKRLSECPEAVAPVIQEVLRAA